MKESDLMGQVYSNSFCNIAATAAENSTKGLFFDRFPGSIIPLRVSINGSDYLINPPHAGMHMVDQAPLVRRAWVYQERILSRRILHFTTSQVFWECKTHCACETYPSTYPVGSFSPPLRRINPGLDGFRIRQRDGGAIFNTSPDAFLDGFALWNILIADYSRCSLTHDTDRLVAISGVAAKFQETLNNDNDEYLAGMWRKHLPYSLTWQALGENSRPTSYTAPTWSWASITGQVKRKSLANVQHQRSVEIIEECVEPAGLSKFGQVNGGFISLKGSLMAIPLSICQSSQPMLPCAGCAGDLETLSLHFTLDISRPGVDRFAEARQRLHFPISYARSLTQARSETNYEYLSVYGVPISAHWLGERREIEGLLLEATGNKIGEFRRIGTFSYMSWRDAQGDFSSQYLEAFRVFDSQAVRLGFNPISTDHLDYDFQYMIKII